jgi:hypothetical protein
MCSVTLLQLNMLKWEEEASIYRFSFGKEMDLVVKSYPVCLHLP